MFATGGNINTHSTSTSSSSSSLRLGMNHTTKRFKSKRGKRKSFFSICYTEQPELFWLGCMSFGLLFVAMLGFMYEFVSMTSNASMNNDPSTMSQSILDSPASMTTTTTTAKLAAGAAASASLRNSQIKKSSTTTPPPPPVLPIFEPVPNADVLIDQLLHKGQPTIGGIVALLQQFIWRYHTTNHELSVSDNKDPIKVIENYITSTQTILKPFEETYIYNTNGENSKIPLRRDDSLFLSVAAFREHLLHDTLVEAFENAEHPEKLNIGLVIQNCFGAINPRSSDGTADTNNIFTSVDIDATGTPCKTGLEVIGKNENGKDMTKMSDAVVDKNGLETFCAMAKYKKYCTNGQIRVLYVPDDDSLGPAVARYYAAKLWFGETYYCQVDSHLLFVEHWDTKYINELKATSNYPKSVLSSYPPGFQTSETKDGAPRVIKESPGALLCRCETRVQDPNPIIRINACGNYHERQLARNVTLQIPFIAAGFFFTDAKFLIDVPFDPYLPYVFMGEEIALSIRAWTSGYNIYAPRYNYIAHQYRPGRLGLPKFWENVNRL